MIKEIASGIYVSDIGIFNIEMSSGFKTSKVEEKPSNIPINNTNSETTSNKAVVWGEDNTRPLEVLKEIRKTGVLGAALMTRADAHFGSGLSLYSEDDEGNKKNIPYRKVPAFKSFDDVNHINRFFIDMIHDLEIHRIAFGEFVLSRDFSQITRIKRQPVPFVRFEEINEKSKLIENVFLNADWDSFNEEYTLKVPCFNMFQTAEEISEICRQKKIYKFIIPITYTTDDEIYYPKPAWQAVIRNGWTKVVQSVPKLKAAIQENQLHFKFLISITEEYFKSQYSESWDTMKDEEKRKKYEDVVDAVDKHMSGAQAGGRSLTAPMYRDANGNQVKSIIIEPIDDKLKDGAYLPDATAGNSEILFATRVDPSLIGQGVPGGKSLSGSGSDKREAYTILCASLVADRMTSLVPFYFLRDWNGWGEDIDAEFRNIALTTLDKNPSGAEKLEI